jgi:hypothetical protein
LEVATKLDCSKAFVFRRRHMIEQRYERLNNQ